MAGTKHALSPFSQMRCYSESCVQKRIQAHVPEKLQAGYAVSKGTDLQNFCV